MIIIGLTGGIASGKSTVSQMLAGHGAVVVDADRLGHEAYLPGTPGYQGVVAAFGAEIVAEDGTIDRRKLGPIVFGNPAKLKQLTDIVWPQIRALAVRRFSELRAVDTAIVVLEAAMLFEAGWDDLCDEIWTAEVERDRAVERLISRNGMTSEAALERINAQLTNEERRRRSTVVVPNNGALEELRAEVDRQWGALQGRLGARSGA